MPRRASLAVLALLAAAAAAASVARADYPSIYVTFLPTSTLRVVLADGTPLGTSSGTPTAIPPGSYNLLLDDSSLVSDVTFDLAGPNVKLITNMSYGEETAETWVETFLPNSTYTWRDDTKPAAVFTFVTSSTPSAGTAPQTGIAPGKSVSTTPIASNQNGKATSTDVVGSAVVPFRGTLLGAVTTGGADTLTSGGKAVTTLKAGRYTVKITDRSAASGFSVQESHKNATNVTGTGFVGKKTHFLVVA